MWRLCGWTAEVAHCLHQEDPLRDAQRCRPDRLDESALVPDGRRIGFSEWSDFLFADIWTAKPDGSDRRRVSTWPLWDFRPSWATPGWSARG